MEMEKEDFIWNLEKSDETSAQLQCQNELVLLGPYPVMKPVLL